jgi:hypothetical protein
MVVLLLAGSMGAQAVTCKKLYEYPAPIMEFEGGVCPMGWMVI